MVQSPDPWKLHMLSALMDDRPLRPQRRTFSLYKAAIRQRPSRWFVLDALRDNERDAKDGDRCTGVQLLVVVFPFSDLAKLQTLD